MGCTHEHDPHAADSHRGKNREKCGGRSMGRSFVPPPAEIIEHAE